jgi:hypothetical protein
MKRICHQQDPTNRLPVTTRKERKGMRKLLLLVGMVLIVALHANAQEPSPEPKSGTVTAEQQQEFQTALKSFQAAQQVLKQAETQSELAFAKLQQVIFKTMAEMGVDPKKYDAKLSEAGNLTFIEKSKTAQAPSTSAPGKP